MRCIEVTKPKVSRADLKTYRMLCPLLIAGCSILVGGQAVADEALPTFKGTERYTVLGPFQNGLLVRTTRDRSFLCDADVANIVLLTNCRPILTPEEVEFFVARDAIIDRQAAIREQRARLADLPVVLYERAARRTLSSQGCQVDISRRVYLASDILPVFASELKVPKPIQNDLTNVLEDYFVESLDVLLRKGDISYDRATNVARLLECDQ